MFQSVRKAVREGVEKTWQTIASHVESGDKPWDHEPNLYKRDMMMYSTQLEDNVDPDCKEDAVRKIGHLSFTGGVEAAKYAGTHIETLVNKLLVDENSHVSLKIQVLRSMSEIIRGHRDNMEKARTLGLISMLANFICDGHNSHLCRWACYILVYMCSTSMVCMKEMVREVEGRECDVALKVLEDLSWKGWPRNYAGLIREVLGYKERKDRIDPRLPTGLNPKVMGIADIGL